jgi:hypothetical protein
VVLPNALRVFSPAEFHDESFYLIQFKTALQKSVIDIPDREYSARKIGREVTYATSNIVSSFAVMNRIELLYLRIDFV